MHLKDYKRAIVCFNLALTFEPTFFQALNNKSAAYFYLDNFDESYKVLTKIKSKKESSISTKHLYLHEMVDLVKQYFILTKQYNQLKTKLY